MDHHCVWINNCVGAKNYKFFLMFLSTTPVSSSQPGGFLYVYMMLSYIFGRVNGQPVPDYIGLPYLKVLFYLMAFLQILFVVMITTLAVVHHILALNNVTTIEVYKGATVSWVPCICLTPETVSPFDGGVIANYIQIFGVNYWQWWLPTHPVNVCCEVEFPRAPEMTDTERQQYSNMLLASLTEPRDSKSPRPAASPTKDTKSS